MFNKRDHVEHERRKEKWSLTWASMLNTRKEKGERNWIEFRNEGKRIGIIGGSLASRRCCCWNSRLDILRRYDGRSTCYEVGCVSNTKLERTECRKWTTIDLGYSRGMRNCESDNVDRTLSLFSGAESGPRTSRKAYGSIACFLSIHGAV